MPTAPSCHQPQGRVWPQNWPLQPRQRMGTQMSPPPLLGPWGRWEPSPLRSARVVTELRAPEEQRPHLKADVFKPQAFLIISHDRKQLFTLFGKLSPFTLINEHKHQ